MPTKEEVLQDLLKKEMEQVGEVSLEREAEFHRMVAEEFGLLEQATDEAWYWKKEARKARFERGEFPLSKPSSKTQSKSDMNADSYFSIGKTHKVCQDYAKVGTYSDWPYAIVSDGCSGSPDTDIGARILVQSVERNLQKGEPWNKRGEEHAKDIALLMGLPLESLDATLIMAYYVPQFQAYNVKAAGDGVVAARHRDGSGIDLHIFEYPSGAPDYPGYRLDPERYEQYKEQYGTDLVYTIKTAEGKTRQMTQNYWPTFLVSPEKYDLLVLMSDGAQSFQRKINTGTSLALNKVPVEEVIPHIMSIKGTKGEFITRRCQRFLGKFCTKNGWSHFDDISVAAIWMGE